jgi:transcriptional regulator with XRE-family HTH domain
MTKTNDALNIIHRRYLENNPERQEQLREISLNARVSELIYRARKKSGLTQQQLADLIGTKQSVIARLEDADYEGHSLSMLQRIAEALGQKIAIEMVPSVPEKESTRGCILNYSSLPKIPVVKDHHWINSFYNASVNESRCLLSRSDYQLDPALSAKYSENYN